MNEVIIEQSFSEELKGYLMGDLSSARLTAVYILVAIGVFVSFTINVKKRDKDSANTPFKFSVWFLVKDNILRVASALAVIYLTARFTGDWMPDIFGLAAYPVIGFAWDKFVIFIREKWYGISEKMFGAAHDSYHWHNKLEKISDSSS